MSKQKSQVVELLKDDVVRALIGILEIGKRDMTNPKYDGYFSEARRSIDCLREVQRAIGGVR